MTFEPRAKLGEDDGHVTPAALIRGEERLRDVIEGAQVGTWTWDFDTVSQLVNDVWARMLGYDLSELSPVTYDTWSRIIHPDDRAAVRANDVGVEIEAALAFGTGHHASTQGCLTALDRLARSGLIARRVADIGGGTGVLAMAAAAIWPARAVAGDIDPVATVTARENVAANGFAGRIACVTAAGFRHPILRRRAPYDLVFATILAGPLKRLAPEMASHQTAGGVAILSGLLTRQAPAVLAVYRGWGYARIDRVPIGEWTTLVLRRN